MSKDPSNPFAQLNARDFPSRSRNAAVQKPRKAKTVVKDKAAEQKVKDEDAELFLQAMGGTVQVLSSREQGRGGSSFLMEDDQDFAKALKSKGVRKLEKKAVPASTPSEEEQDDAPATLTAMALAGRKIARRDDAQAMQEAAGQSSEKDDSLDFFKAIKGTTPLQGSGRDIPMEPETPPIPVHDPRHPLQDFMDGKVEFSVASTDEYAEGYVLGLDLSIVAQLQARQFSPEAHIDLHGLNSEQAFQAMLGFFRSSYYKGVRTALVVTGRGLNSFNGIPVLRARVQDWFTQDPFKRVVLAFCTAKQEDGGAGAFYVLLRKYKKSSGKIRWEAMPSDPDLFL